MRGVSPIRVLPGLALDVLGDPEREVGEETLCVWMEAGPGIDTLQPGGSSNMLILGSIMDLSVKGDGPMSHLSSDCKEGWGDSGEKVEAGRPLLGAGLSKPRGQINLAGWRVMVGNGYFRLMLRCSSAGHRLGGREGRRRLQSSLWEGVLAEQISGL